MTTDLFTRLGFLVVEDFLPPDDLAVVLADLRQAPFEPAGVYQTSTGFVLREETRKTRIVTPSPATVAQVVDRFMGLKEQAEVRFEVTITGCQAPSFLRYQPGDFFDFHIDRNTDPDALETIQRRLVSLVLFLNDRADPDDCLPGHYSGGDLTFLTHIGPAKNVPLKVPFRARAGTLVAFPAFVPHEVRPVLTGERYSVVSWFE